MFDCNVKWDNGLGLGITCMLQLLSIEGSSCRLFPGLVIALVQLTSKALECDILTLEFILPHYYLRKA